MMILDEVDVDSVVDRRSSMVIYLDWVQSRDMWPASPQL